MTAPEQPDSGLTPAQLAVVLALVQAQAALRQQLTQTAINAATAPLQAFAGWWSGAAVGALVDQILRIVQPAQRQAARVTDAYLARVATIMTGRTIQPVGAVDVARLRRDITRAVARELVDGDRKPAWLELGDTVDGPNANVNDRVRLAVPERALLAPGEPYGRVAEGYRWQVVAEGVTEEKARQRAIVRISAVAQTDVTLAVREQYKKSLGQLKANGYRRILHPELTETGPCGLCVVAADRTYHVEDLLPIHAQCVPAGTRVAAAGVSAATRRRYRGPFVILGTASGQQLTITPNHPVLTDRGWVPAGLVDQGDNLVRHVGAESSALSYHNENDRPALVENIWNAVLASGRSVSVRSPAGGQEFHGDRSDGEVHIVWTNGRLAPVGRVSFQQPVGELFDAGRHRHRVLLARHRTSVVGEPLGGIPHIAGDENGLDRIGLDTILFRDVLEGPPLPVQEDDVVGFLGRPAAISAGSPLNILVANPVAYRSCADVEIGGDLRNRVTSLVSLDRPIYSVGGRPRPARRFDPASSQGGVDDRLARASLGLDLLQRLSGLVTFDQVVNVRRVDGTHDVYNLQTAEGWYAANSIVVSNCVCEVLPVLGEQDPGLTLNADDLAKVYRAAGSTGGGKREGGALKKIRVALAEHGELGPVLVDADQHYRSPADVARTKADPRTRAQAELDALEERNRITRYRVEHGEPLDKTLKWQAARIEELRQELTGTS